MPEGSRGVLCASGWVRPKDHLLDVLNVTFRVRTSQISQPNPVLHFGVFLETMTYRPEGEREYVSMTLEIFGEIIEAN